LKSLLRVGYGLGENINQLSRLPKVLNDQLLTSTTNKAYRTSLRELLSPVIPQFMCLRRFQASPQQVDHEMREMIELLFRSSQPKMAGFILGPLRHEIEFIKRERLPKHAGACRNLYCSLIATWAVKRQFDRIDALLRENPMEINFELLQEEVVGSERTQLFYQVLRNLVLTNQPVEVYEALLDRYKDYCPGLTEVMVMAYMAMGEVDRAGLNREGMLSDIFSGAFNMDEHVNLLDLGQLGWVRLLLEAGHVEDAQALAEHMRRRSRMCPQVASSELADLAFQLIEQHKS
jgi:hypothetical protein